MEIKNFDIGKLVYCFFCERQISSLTYIICQECDNFSICVKCFANGKENEKHLKSHKYKINKKMNFKITSDTWTAYDELRIFSAIESCGFGNWDEISNLLGNKTSHECELFIKNNYLKSQNNYKESLINKLKDEYKIYEPEEEEHNEEKKSFEDILGFMKKRGDFEVEYDNDAELFLAEMEFDIDEKEDETDLKLNIINIYNERLIQRKLRKDFVIDRGILDLKKRSQEDKKKPKEQIEIENLLKVFERFHSKEEHNDLIKDIMKERELSRTLEELLMYKSMGFENFEEIEKYNLDKRDDNMDYVNEGKKLLNKINNDNFNKENIENYSARRSSRIKNNFNKEYEEVSKLYDRNNYSFLLNEEMELSKELNITLNAFWMVKEAIIRLSIKDGSINVEQLKEKIKVNENIIRKIYDFLVDKNLVFTNSNE